MKLHCQTIDVALADRSYPIHIAPQLLDDFSSQADWLARYQRAVIITDSNVSKLYLKSFKRRLKKQISVVDSAVCPAGEKAKVIEIAYSIWQKMVGFEADRKTLLVALGGGVVGDLAGFVAATFLRGLDWLQVPTTLLAQVDSSVGGKVGINLPQGKNLVGAFWQPSAVWIDPLVLQTLDRREFQAGMAEVIKYGMILDSDLFAYLEANVKDIIGLDRQRLSHLISRCCQLKADVVAADEREVSGQRAVLNFGHTYGHALENVSGYGQILHGEAVAVGMICATRLAIALDRVDREVLPRLESLVQAFGLPTRFPDVDHQAILTAMQTDKKKVNQSVNLILPRSIGSVELVPWPGDSEVMESLVGS